VNKVLSFQVGYSQIFATGTLQYLDAVPSMAPVQNWAYVALLVRPNMAKRFTGLQF
jgi:hypothetical protein